MIKRLEVEGRSQSRGPFNSHFIILRRRENAEHLLKEVPSWIVGYLWCGYVCKLPIKIHGSMSPREGEIRLATVVSLISDGEIEDNSDIVSTLTAERFFVRVLNLNESEFLKEGHRLMRCAFPV